LERRSLLRCSLAAGVGDKASQLLSYELPPHRGLPYVAVLAELNSFELKADLIKDLLRNYMEVAKCILTHNPAVRILIHTHGVFFTAESCIMAMDIEC